MRLAGLFVEANSFAGPAGRALANILAGAAVDLGLREGIGERLNSSLGGLAAV